MAIVTVTDDTFEQDVLKSGDLVLVDFWAEWCGPCKMLSPILDDISEEKGEDLKVAKVNIDDNPNAPTQFGVRSIPTLALFKNGELLSTQVGVQPKHTIEAWIEENR